MHDAKLRHRYGTRFSIDDQSRCRQHQQGSGLRSPTTQSCEGHSIRILRQTQRSVTCLLQCVPNVIAVTGA